MCHLPLLCALLLVPSGCTSRLLDERPSQDLPESVHARAAAVIAVSVDLPSRDSAAGLERRLWTAPAGAAPGAILIQGGDPSAVAHLVSRIGARSRPTLIASRGASPASPPAAARFGGYEPADPDAALRTAEAAHDRSLLGIDLGFVEVPLPAPLSPRPRVDLEELAARVAQTIRDAADAGNPLGLAILAPASARPQAGPALTRDAFLRPLVAAAAAAGAPALLLPAPLLSHDHMATVRRELGWDGLVLVDARGEAEGTQAVAAIAAGADLVWISGDPAAAAQAIADGVRTGRVSAEALERSAERALGWAERLGATRRPIAPSAAAARLGASPDSGRSPADPHDPAWVMLGDTLIPGAPAEAGLAAGGLAGAEDAILEALEDSVMTAAALAVGRRGRLVALAGYERLPDGSAVVADRTLFDLASLSKVVGTTTAVGMLIDEGRLALDAPVSRYLPEYAGEGKEAVTLRHLLSHSSGLPSGLWVYGSAESPDDAMAQVMAQPLRRAAGESAEYSDLGMMILAAVVERVAGEPLEDYLAENLFLPLGMARTTYLPPLRIQNEIVPTTAGATERPYPLHGIVHDANAFRLGGVAGHAGLFSTARDVAVFAQMMLQEGVYGPAEILTAETARELTREQPGTDGRALGWDTPDERSSAGRYFSSDSYGHTGYTGTSLWIDPRRDLFVVLLTNRTFTEASAQEIFDLRVAVHEAVARAVTDEPVARRRE